MRILLTGATGFVGSHILKALLQDGHEVHIVKRSYSNTERIKNVLDECTVYNLDEMAIQQIYEEASIDCVVHCATYYGRNDRECMKNIESNLLFPLELLSLGSENGVKYFINTDSFFGNQIENEEDLDKDLYMYGYTLSKTQFRQWGHMFAEKYRTRFINMKLEHVYGAGDGDSKFIPYIWKACSQNVPTIALSMGTQRRDFVHVSDVVSAYRVVISGLESGNETGYVNYEVGTGREWSLREFVEIIHEAVCSTTHLEWGAIPMKPGELMYSKADNAKLVKLGWTPKIVEPAEIKRVFGGRSIITLLSPLGKAV